MMGKALLVAAGIALAGLRSQAAADEAPLYRGSAEVVGALGNRIATRGTQFSDDDFVLALLRFPSWLTAKITAIANSELAQPDVCPTPVASAVTRAEWALGIPPVSTSTRKFTLWCLPSSTTSFKA